MIYFSFSKHNDLRQCAKKWAYIKLEKLSGKKSDAMQKGVLIHEEIEAGLQTGKKTSRVVWAKKILEKYQITNFKIEQKLEKQIDDITLVGVADIISDSTILDWKTGKKPQAEDTKTIAQLHLYGYLSDSQPETLVGAYTEHDWTYSTYYDPEYAKQVIDQLLDGASQAQQLIDNFVSAEEIQGKPTRLCRWCEFYDVCPDNFETARKKLKK